MDTVLGMDFPNGFAKSKEFVGLPIEEHRLFLRQDMVKVQAGIVGLALRETPWTGFLF